MKEHSNMPMKNEEDNDSLERVSVWLIILIFCVSVWVLIFLSTTAHAYTEEQMVKAVIGEAEGEPQHGKEAVACAIRNRGTLHGVYGLNAPRVKHHLYSEKTYQNAVYAVEMSRNSDYCQSLIHGAQFWEGTKFPIPYWADGMYQTAIIGNQRFFLKK